MTRTILLAAALAASSLMTGCANAPEPVRQDPALLRATHGFVRATIPQDPATGPRGLELRQERTGAAFQLYPQPDEGPSSYGFWLPAGDYRLVDLKQQDGKPYPAMHVEAGRILDLGAVVTLPLGDDKLLDLVLPHPEAAAQLEETTRRLAPYLTDKTAAHWSTEAVPASRNVPQRYQTLGFIADVILEFNRRQGLPPLRERVKSAASSVKAYQMMVASVPPVSDQPGVGPDGRRYYPASLGQIRVRDPQGQWSNLDTGTLAKLASVEVSGQRIVAGTIDGRLRISDDAGKTWRSSQADFGGQRVADIDRIGDRWFVISTSEGRLGNGVRYIPQWQLSLLKGDLLDERVSLHQAATHWAVIDENYVRGVHPKDGSAYYINAFDSVVKVDPATLAVSRLAQPFPAVTRFNIGEDQRTLNVYLSRGTASTLSVSTDGGQTWQTRPAPTKMGLDIYFDQAGIGRATRWEYGTWTNAIQLDDLPPGAANWVVGPKMPPDCILMLKDERQAPVTCLRPDDSLMTVRDGKWVVEFAS